MWTFSIYLETVAIVPQLYMSIKFNQTSLSIFTYILSLFLYRLLYILNWMYRYKTEGFYDKNSYLGGIGEVIVYIIGLFWFIKLYLVKKYNEKYQVDNFLENSKLIFENI